MNVGGGNRCANTVTTTLAVHFNNTASGRIMTAAALCCLHRFALGEYYPGNESWVTAVQTATIDYGPNSNWEYAGFVGAVKTDKDKRFMNIGCVLIFAFGVCRGFCVWL